MYIYACLHVYIFNLPIKYINVAMKNQYLTFSLERKISKISLKIKSQIGLYRCHNRCRYGYFVTYSIYYN